MNKQVLKAVMDFMQRVTIQGSEAQTWMKCMQDLNEEYHTIQEVPNTKEPDPPKAA